MSRWSGRRADDATGSTDEAPAPSADAGPVESGRAYDEHGNVRPADSRYIPAQEEADQ